MAAIGRRVADVARLARSTQTGGSRLPEARFQDEVDVLASAHHRMDRPPPRAHILMSPCSCLGCCA